MTITPGQSVHYRYRVIIHPGTVKDADIARPLRQIYRRALMSLTSWKRRLRPRPLIQLLEIRDLNARALTFQERLAAAKNEQPPPDPGWYPWDSFGALTHLDRLLTGRRRFLEPLIGDLPSSISAAATEISPSSSTRSAAASAPSITRPPTTTAWPAWKP